MIETLRLQEARETLYNAGVQTIEIMDQAERPTATGRYACPDCDVRFIAISVSLISTAVAIKALSAPDAESRADDIRRALELDTDRAFMISLRAGLVAERKSCPCTNCQSLFRAFSVILIAMLQAFEALIGSYDEELRGESVA